MVKFEELRPGLQVEGILPYQPVTVVDVSWHGTQTVTLIYKRADGQPRTRILYRADEERLHLLQAQCRWPFDADGAQRLDAPFAYATGKDNEGYHTGVLIRKLGSVYFDDQSLLVHPNYVQEPPPPEPDITPPDLDGKEGGEGEFDEDERVTPKPETETTRKPVRYYGRVQLDPQRVTKEMDVVVEEVIQRLTELVGCDVEITVEISASKPDGFDEGIVRTVSENGRTLKFDSFEFEEG